MFRPIAFSAVCCALALPAAAQGVTVTNNHGGKTERSHTASSDAFNRGVERTTAGGQSMGRDIEWKKTGVGEASRTVTGSGPNGGGNTRRATVSRN